MSELIKFPKIGQFKDAVYEVKRRACFMGLNEYDEPIINPAPKLPKLTFTGQVKLHGTNASVVLDKSETRYQSRNRVLTVDDDNMGFAAHATQTDWQAIFKPMIVDGQPLVIYGEWCGQGIQTNVAISELPKSFVIFAARSGDKWVSRDAMDLACRNGLPVVNNALGWRIHINFANPEACVATLRELTEAVERECPYAKFHGVSGTGEGIVWTCDEAGYEDVWFKAKGEKHSKSRVKTLSPVDAEKIGKAKALAAEIMTPDRLAQGIQYLEEMNLEIHRKNLGVYLKYVVSDCLAEELLTISEQNFEAKSIGKHLSEIAKAYFFQVESSFIAA